MKKQKTALTPAEQAAIQAHPLVQLSGALSERERAREGELNAYYTRLAEQPSDLSSAEAIETEIRALKTASKDMMECYLRTTNMTDELEARYHDAKVYNRGRRLNRHPTNAAVDLREQRAGHFAKGLNFYKIMLIFIIGCFLGVVIETAWCMLTRGHYESRVGLVYGPFNLVYGIGAAVLSVSLYRLRNHGAQWSFLGGALVGSAVEYVCSWAQEMVLGSTSWDYSDMPFNLNGRICLLYAAFWGILGVLWIKNIYPRITSFILKLPNGAGKLCTWALIAFLLFDSAVSGIATYRWSQRAQGAPASSAFWESVDERFPNARMEKLYPNMEFAERIEMEADG